MLRNGIIIILIFVSARGLAQHNGIKIAFQLINNHIYLQGKLNDSLPVWVLLDCGSSSLVSERQAIKGNIKRKSLGQTTGTGNGVATYQIADSVAFDLGAVHYVEKRMPVLSLDEVEDCAALVTAGKDGKIALNTERSKNVQPMDAILGNKFFQRYVVEIDFQKMNITLYEPATFHYSGNGEQIHLEYRDNHIFIAASLRGSDSISAAGQFMVDCGSMTGIILNVPFIKQHQLHPPADATEISVCGIGGNSRSMMGTLADLRIGQQVIKEPVAIFSQALGGVLTSPDMAGTIGNAVLRNFRVIFDYSRGQMILERNVGFPEL